MRRIQCPSRINANTDLMKEAEEKERKGERKSEREKKKREVQGKEVW